jgi:uncharacterized protein YoaH (UPF0181 family)
MELQAAISKTARYSSTAQGDNVEIIERPTEASPSSWLRVSSVAVGPRIVAMKAVHSILSLIANGMHDGAASRMVLSNIFEDYKGKAQVSLHIISCDLESQSIVITKNNTTPVVTVFEDAAEYLRFDGRVQTAQALFPSVIQFEIEEGRDFILVSDGILQAGTQYEQPLDLRVLVESLFEDEEPTVQEVADAILNQAISQDVGRPQDDMTVTVFCAFLLLPHQYPTGIVQFPINVSK